MDIINNNPYRILGVYSNSPTKERLANHNRMKAFLKVGKPVSFPLDLPQYLSSINRDDSIISDAVAKLTLPKEQILYSQFWFVNTTPFDEVAFKHLLSEEMDKAEEIWQKKESASSLQNLIVCSLVRDDYGSAMHYAEKLYGNVQYVKQLVSAVVGVGGDFDTSNLAFTFIDTLCEEIGASKLLHCVSINSWKSHIEENAVKPLISNIESAIGEAAKSKRKGAEANFKAGVTLWNNTSEDLAQLKELLSPEDLQYQTIADKLGLAILDCGIAYYNNSDEPDSAIKAMKLQKYALGIVVGQMAKDRCKKNVDILQKTIDNIPPKEVYEEDMAIRHFFRKFASQPHLIKYSIQLLKDCVPSLVSIKDKLGNNHRYYLHISSEIVNTALSYLIDEVNAAQEVGFPKLKNVLIEAWRAQLYMDKFDLDSEFKSGRYKENRDALYNLISDCKGFKPSIYSSNYRYGCGWCLNLKVDDLDLRTEYEVYSYCDSIGSYKEYIKRFPQGKYTQRAKGVILQKKREKWQNIKSGLKNGDDLFIFLIFILFIILLSILLVKVVMP